MTLICRENSKSTNSVGGKKLWLRRHAAESVSEESLQNTDISASFESLSCAADSTSDIASVQSKAQASPSKKTRHVLDGCQYDEHVAATALAQMGGKSGGFRFHWSVALRYLIPNLIDGQHTDFCLTGMIRKPLPTPSSHNAVKVTTAVADNANTASQLHVIGPVEVKKAKRLSLEDYKKRRSTLGSSDSKNASNKTSASNVSANATVGNRNSFGSMARSTRSFMPLMDSSVEQNATLRNLEADTPIPSLGVPPDLEVVKKMILQESCIPPPPAPPSLPTQKASPATAGLASSSDMSIGSSSESGEERMSLADRLAKEFGVGTAGGHRYSPKIATPPFQRPTLTAGISNCAVQTDTQACHLRAFLDVPPPPPPGPRPSRIAR
ncbi:hypothetical protein DICVIV_03819 [Dictyocaulus viviparus]|uniref:Uncharacterized protein n=1 Tax=Dictyocaulus viviparus TaxID=29172 RepID=A0A0D8XZC5_DICVI|nr:hypothetical protein DICVIV_03819 [Dictyocaulus viviparus]